MTPAEVAVPDYWDAQPKDANGKEKIAHLVQLAANKDEYKEVERHFHLTQPGTIVTIERVQNPGLYRIYAVKKKEMDEQKRANEKWLFHDKAAKNVADINIKGLNRSFSGTNGEYNFFFVFLVFFFFFLVLTNILSCFVSPLSNCFLVLVLLTLELLLFFSFFFVMVSIQQNANSSCSFAPKTLSYLL